MAKLCAGLAATACIGLVGCGGGGDSNVIPARSSCVSGIAGLCDELFPPGSGTTTNTTAQTTALEGGLFVGTTSSGRATTGLVLDDGSYYFIYSLQGDPTLIAGAIQGAGTALNGSFSSGNSKDISLEGLGLLSGSISASYAAKQSFNGSITYPSLNQTVTFTSTYDSRYELTPSLAIIAGNYSGRTGTISGAENTNLSISASGAVVGVGSSGCRFSGTVTPRTKGNAYNVSTTFGGSPCRLPGVTVTGAAYFDATTQRLFAVALTAARDDGAIFAGGKL